MTVMRDHQKYFAVEDADGKLAPHFLAVLNTEVDAEGEAIIRHGNARVLQGAVQGCAVLLGLRPEDAAGRARGEPEERTFQKELGSYHWKTEQNLAVARALATKVKAAGVAV